VLPYGQLFFELSSVEAVAGVPRILTKGPACGPRAKMVPSGASYHNQRSP
jgi:hypothetical protein